MIDARGLLQSGTLALWSVLRNRRRVAVAIGSVTFGIAALILAGGFIEWIFWATREGTIQTGLGHIHVVRSGYLKNTGMSKIPPMSIPINAKPGSVAASQHSFR